MASSPHEVFKKFPIEPHHEISEIFADHIGLSAFDGHNCKMEFAIARMEEPKPPAQPTGKRHIVARLVLSVECVVDLINHMNSIGAQLVKTGVIKIDQGQATPQPRPN